MFHEAAKLVLILLSLLSTVYVCVCLCVFLAEQSQCQQELDKVLEEISKMTFHDNKGHLENLYELTFPNCDSNGQYNVKQVCHNMNLLLGYIPDLTGGVSLFYPCYTRSHPLWNILLYCPSDQTELFNKILCRLQGKHLALHLYSFCI